MADRKADPVWTSQLNVVNSLLWKVHELETTIQDFTPDSQPLLEARMGALVQELQKLRNTYESEAVQNWTASRPIPEELVKYLDEGGNPDDYTKNVFKACLRDNQISAGKVQGLQQFQESLLAEVSTAFPELAAEYKALLAQQPSTEGADVKEEPAVG